MDLFGFTQKPLNTPEEQRRAQVQEQFYHYANFITSVIQEVAVARADNIRDAYRLRGGWEPWFQIELTLALKRAFAGAVSVSREEPVYTIPSPAGGYKKNDILVTARLEDTVDLSVSIELKCEGFHNPDKFTDAVSEDLDKMRLASISNHVKPCFALNIFASVNFVDTIKQNAPGFREIPGSAIDMGNNQTMRFLVLGKDFINIDGQGNLGAPRMKKQDFIEEEH